MNKQEVDSVKETSAQHCLTYEIWCDCPYCGEPLRDYEINEDFHEFCGEGQPRNDETFDQEVVCPKCGKEFIIKEVYTA